uniref:NADH-ubiquinone oxidoreductase chain 2 n=1 Tax=Selenops bursarius TaxID=881841 RepID=A0A0U1X9L7_9ARAC|nr:NADH dehydrogenase subunit 2 [Selenops bursarius]AIM52652.1 NADH dehydrogenase subunit 2 [Selenops bursarius]
MLIPSFMLFLFMYLISFLFVMSNDDWFLVWLGLEINMLSFIIMIYKRYDMLVMESCMKYFFIQSMGSAVLMGCFFLDLEMFSEILILMLSYKIGAGPFFMWFPSVCGGLSWFSCFVLMTFQKLIPLMLMGMFVSWIIWWMVMMSLVFGACGSFNQKDIKRLLAYSSIHHLGWMMLCILLNDGFWLIYLFLYSIILLNIVYLFKEYEVIDLIVINKWKGKWWFVMGMLSMAGMPPLLGFFLKWMAFVYILNMNFICILFLILMSVVMFYIYIRVMYDILMDTAGGLSWSNYVIYKNYIDKMDYFSVFGLLLGVMVGVMLVF